MFSRLSDWLNYLEDLHPVKIDLTLDRVLTVAARMELLHFDSKVIIVGGTNGKGTTCALLESILSKNEYSVGVYSSPHLHVFNERIRVNKSDVTDEKIIEAFQVINVSRGNISLTYFEFATLATLYIFKNTDLDFIILEIGLGGRLDSVNIVHRDVAIITSIGIDHVNHLGNSIESIGYEKAHIYKDNCYAILGANNLPLSIKEYIKIHNINLKIQNKDFKYSMNGDYLNWYSKDIQIDELKLPGKIVPANLSCALECLRGLGLNNLLTEEIINKSLSDFSIFGRYSIVQRKIPIIFDVAHNFQALNNLANQLPTGGRNIAVFSICRDKNIAEAINIYKNYFKYWYIMIFNHDARMAKPQDYIEIFKNLRMDNYTFLSSSKELVDRINVLTNFNRVIVFGSFRLVGEINKVVNLIN